MMLDGSTCTFIVRPWCTVREVQRQVEERMGVAASRQRLYCEHFHEGARPLPVHMNMEQVGMPFNKTTQRQKQGQNSKNTNMGKMDADRTDSSRYAGDYNSYDADAADMGGERMGVGAWVEFIVEVAMDEGMFVVTGGMHDKVWLRSCER